MNASRNLPEARTVKRPRLSPVWIVPVIAGVAALVLVFQHVRRLGPRITIRFESGEGLMANQTVVRYRGVRIGKVESIRLAEDSRHVEVIARLERDAASLAREGTTFWIVHPEVGLTGLRGLETIISGIYIQAEPSPDGGGRKETKFAGCEVAPIIRPPGGGVEYVLRAPANSSLSEKSPVSYRGAEVGAVLYLELSPDATAVEVHVLIAPNYAPLVRTNTVWWNAGGINVNMHLLGVKVHADSLSALVMGGIDFATPTDPGPPAPTGMVFTLHDKPENKWLEWSPAIRITNARSAMPARKLPAIDFKETEPSPKSSSPAISQNHEP